MSKEIQVVRFDSSTISKLRKVVKLHDQFWNLLVEVQNEIGQKYEKENKLNMDWSHFLTSDSLDALQEYDDGKLIKSKPRIEEVLRDWVVGDFETQT
jgi:hypothetical protein